MQFSRRSPTAERPIIFAGPQLSNVSGRALLATVWRPRPATPAVILESPRGIADATLGAFADLLRRVDLIVLLGKALDFTTHWASGPAFDPDVRLIAIDPEAALVERAVNEKGERLLLGCIADIRTAAETLIARAAMARTRQPDWLIEARAALDHRPAAWANVVAKSAGRLHPAEVFRALRPFVERESRHGSDLRRRRVRAVGPEHAAGAPPARSMASPARSAASLSFALSARLLEPEAPVFAVLGDGTIGFHIAEFETAVRRGLPFVAVLGNDARWNAESQIQRRDYGANRMHGCELLPGALRPGGDGARRPWRHCRATPPTCPARSSARWQAASLPASTS